MSKDELADWSATAANNTDVGGISLAEGMNPAGVNNAMREIMAQIATDLASKAWGAEGEDVDGTSLNDITASGVYGYGSDDPGIPSVAAGVCLTLKRTSLRMIQIAAPCTTGTLTDLFFRERSGDGWSNWREIVHHATSNDHFFITNSGVTVSDTETGVSSPTDAAYGASLLPDGQIRAAVSNGVAAIIKRSNDGTHLQWYTGTTLVGGVSSSGGVVTYGSFCGSHWSQLRGGVKREILPGTILESIDRLCEWDDAKETVLPQVQVAQPGSRAVYGVFSHWDEDGDMHVASLGAHSIRIAKGAAVKRGDLIEAGPNGCGVVQADDVFRASTVAKVTAAVKTAGYEDGSYLVPCTLHCG